MKILLVVTYYRPHWTGLTRYAARLAEHFTKGNLLVSVLCNKHLKKLKRRETINGVGVIRVPCSWKFNRTQISPFFVFEFIRNISKFDTVVVFLPLTETLLVCVIARLFGKKTILVHNGDLVLPKGFINKILEGIYYITTDLSIRLSYKIVVHTEDYSMNSKLLCKHKSKWVTIVNPCNIDKPSRIDVNAFKRKHDLMNKVIIGYAGRFVEEKGVDFLLKAIPKVVKSIPNAHFVFAGETEVYYEDYWRKIEPLVKKYKDHITLLGLINKREKMAVFYSALDVLVVPSRTDCFPNTQIEAMLLGIPVVCTNIPGARWAVKNTGMGLLVNPQNSKSLSEGIVNVVINKEKYVKSKEFVSQIFNYKGAFTKYEKIINN